jgi:hypothetical protein
MDLTSIPSAGVHRDTATSDDPAGLAGAGPLNGQTGLFIYSKSPVQVWQRSAAGEWTVAATLTGAAGSRKHSINWGDLTRIYVKSTSGSDVTVRFVGQTTSAPVAQGAAVNTWSGLSDTPNAYAGHGGKYPKVKSDESGIEFVESAGGGGADASGNITLGDGADAGDSQNALVLKEGSGPSTPSSTQAYIYSKTYPADVIAHFPFNGTAGNTDLTSADFADATGNGHSLTLNNGNTSNYEIATDSFRVGSASLKTDGTARFNFDDHADYAFGTGDFTIMAWVREYAPNADGDNVLYRGENMQIRIYINDDSTLDRAAHVRDAGGTKYAEVPEEWLPNDAWYHLAVIRKSGILKIYIDGIMRASDPYTENITDTVHKLSMGYGSEGFKGYIDDLVIAKKALYTQNFTPPAPFSSTQKAALHVTDGAGNETKISPHNEDGEWEYVSRNKITGKSVRINMEKMIKKLEDFTGETFIEED